MTLVRLYPGMYTSVETDVGKKLSGFGTESMNNNELLLANKKRR